jgi:hypothetical protein
VTRGMIMPHRSKLLAWVEPQGDEEFVAAFVGGAAPQRAPAVQVSATPEEAREWIEHEAAEFGLPVEWLSRAPRR